MRLRELLTAAGYSGAGISQRLHTSGEPIFTHVDLEVYRRRLAAVPDGLSALISLLLFALAPISAWSWFANLLNIPLLLLMFVAEYAYRLLRFPGFSHASFLTAMRAFRAVGRAAVIQSR